MKTNKIQQEKFLSLLQNRFDIFNNYNELQGKTLEELNFTEPEIDLLLN